MSGWIKVEKDLETDPRVLRMARALGKRFQFYSVAAVADPCNACALPSVTLVCGGLTRLWIFADSHIREDDTLDMDTAEIDELLGIPGFCSLTPPDWLRAIDDHTVELPGFQEHNGVEAKRRALTQKRVERHRGAAKRESVTPGNADALPDQTRPDQDQTIGENARESAGDAGPPDPDWQEFLEVRKAYPQGTYRDTAWQQAERSYQKLIDDGATHAELLEAATAYAAQQQAAGNIGTQYVLSPAKFFTDGHWRGPFQIALTPEQRAADERATRERADWGRIKAWASGLGCPHQPHEHDTTATFETRVNAWKVHGGAGRQSAPVAISTLLAGSKERVA